jgi:hypothetical protein
MNLNFSMIGVSTSCSQALSCTYDLSCRLNAQSYKDGYMLARKYLYDPGELEEVNHI